MKLNIDMLLGGIDECNKGEVLNPIVLACCYTVTPLTAIPLLKDSKKNPDLNDLDQILRKYEINYKIIQIMPEEIVKGELNKIILQKQLLLMALVKADLFYVDSIESNSKKLNSFYSFNGFKTVVQVRMDESNPLVSLASLIALRRKKQNLKKLELETGFKVGSGNLRDPITVNYIKTFYPTVKGLKKTWSLKSLNL